MSVILNGLAEGADVAVAFFERRGEVDELVEGLFVGVGEVVFVLVEEGSDGFGLVFRDSFSGVEVSEGALDGLDGVAIFDVLADGVSVVEDVSELVRFGAGVFGLGDVLCEIFGEVVPRVGVGGRDLSYYLLRHD